MKTIDEINEKILPQTKKALDESTKNYEEFLIGYYKHWEKHKNSPVIVVEKEIIDNLSKENIQLRIARNSLIETVNKYKEHAYKAMKMLDDWFYTSNHKLKAYECCQELSEIIKDDEELLKKVRCLDDSRN